MKKALKLARTALGVQLDALLGKAGHLHNDDRRRYAEQGIKAIDEALAQPKEPEQEQIAVWLEKECDEQYLADRVRAGDYVKEKGHTENCAAFGDDCSENHLPPSRFGVGESDYTSQPEQRSVSEHLEPVAEIHSSTLRWIALEEDRPTNALLYTTPPQRTWVGLTDEEFTRIQKETPYTQFMTVSEYALQCQIKHEAMLKGKNT